MKRIGLIGGMSWESTALYYRLLNEQVSDRLGGLHSADCVVLSVDFAEIEQMQAAGDWRRASVTLSAAAVSVQRAGAELLLLCTNTMHKVADDIAAAVTIPLLHIADVAAAAALAAGMSRIGLLGTSFTMEQAFYRDRLAGTGLDVLTPRSDDRAMIHRVIFEELCLGDFREDSRRRFQDVIQSMAERGAQGVVLGCTEIELLIADDQSPLPVLPTTRLHVKAAVDAALLE